MNIKNYVFDSIYDIFREFMYNDRSAAKESADAFWKEVIEQQISLDNVDEHLKKFCLEEYKSFEKAEEEL